ncbi:MAG: FAD-dependent oxidoreductase, partial [Xanthobacteraceae bacterium]
MSEPLVIVGNGMAAARLVRELAARALGRHAVAVIGDEPGRAIDRRCAAAVAHRHAAVPPRSGGLELDVVGRDLLGEQRRQQNAVVGAARTVLLADGGKLRFAKLVIATGSRPARLPVHTGPQGALR